MIIGPRDGIGSSGEGYRKEPRQTPSREESGAAILEIYDTEGRPTLYSKYALFTGMIPGKNNLPSPSTLPHYYYAQSPGLFGIAPPQFITVAAQETRPLETLARIIVAKESIIWEEASIPIEISYAPPQQKIGITSLGEIVYFSSLPSAEASELQQELVTAYRLRQDPDNRFSPLPRHYSLLEQALHNEKGEREKRWYAAISSDDRWFGKEILGKEISADQKGFKELAEAISKDAYGKLTQQQGEWLSQGRTIEKSAPSLLTISFSPPWELTIDPSGKTARSRVLGDFAREKMLEELCAAYPRILTEDWEGKITPAEIAEMEEAMAKLSEEEAFEEAPVSRELVEKLKAAAGTPEDEGGVVERESSDFQPTGKP